jgi:uncharacterized protein
MEVLIWIGIGALFLFSLAGVFIPVIPDALLVWAAFLLYRFGIGEVSLGWSFWLPMTVLTLFLIAADMLANMYFVKRYGGDKWSMFAAVAGVILGPLLLGVFLGPFSIIVGPFLAVFAVGIVQKNDAQRSLQMAMGTVLGFLSSGVVKIIIQLIMIIWFLVVVL